MINEKTVQDQIADLICDMSQLVIETMDVDTVLASKYKRIMQRLIKIQGILEKDEID